MVYVKEDYRVYVSSAQSILVAKQMIVKWEEENKWCDNCCSDPCTYGELKEALTDKGFQFLTTMRGTGNPDTKIKMSYVQFYLYTHATREFHGVLGKGVWISLPKCVEEHIKVLYLDSQRDYVGYTAVTNLEP